MSLSIYLSIYLSISLSLSLCLSFISLPIYLSSVCLRVCLSVWLSVCLSVFYVYLFIHLFIYVLVLLPLKGKHHPEVTGPPQSLFFIPPPPSRSPGGLVSSYWPQARFLSPISCKIEDGSIPGLPQCSIRDTCLNIIVYIIYLSVCLSIDRSIYIIYIYHYISISLSLCLCECNLAMFDRSSAQRLTWDSTWRLVVFVWGIKLTFGSDRTLSLTVWQTGETGCKSHDAIASRCELARWGMQWKSKKGFNCFISNGIHVCYMVTFTINIPPMLAYIPYMDPMGIVTATQHDQHAGDHCEQVQDHLSGSVTPLVAPWIPMEHWGSRQLFSGLVACSCCIKTNYNPQGHRQLDSWDLNVSTWSNVDDEMPTIPIISGEAGSSLRNCGCLPTTSRCQWCNAVLSISEPLSLTTLALLVRGSISSSSGISTWDVDTRKCNRLEMETVNISESLYFFPDGVRLFRWQNSPRTILYIIQLFKHFNHSFSRISAGLFYVRISKWKNK